MSKRESIEDFLARGGVITKCPPAPSAEEVRLTMPTPNGGSTMMTLAEGGLYYSETKIKTKEKKKKPAKAINFAALPPSLMKFVPNNED
jgi:hypothetical protein